MMAREGLLQLPATSCDQAPVHQVHRKRGCERLSTSLSSSSSSSTVAVAVVVVVVVAVVVVAVVVVVV